MQKNLQAIILAGGKSTRFKTGKTKLIEKVCGQELILYPIHLMQTLHLPTTVVVGFQQEQIIDVIAKNNIKNTVFIQQVEQLGSGHAAATSKVVWEKENILIMNADLPLLTPDCIEKLYKKHIKADADISFITAHNADTTQDGHSRMIIQDNQIKVIEKFDTSLDSDAQCCVSAGVYIMKRSFLEEHIDTLTLSHLTGEYYLPELIQIASIQNCKIVTSQVSYDIVREINTLAELWAVEHIKRSQIISHWMNHGVRFVNTLNVIIDNYVTIEAGAMIGSGVHVLGNSLIKQNAQIGAFAYIQDSIIEEDALIMPHTVITQSTIGKQAQIQPFSHIQHQYIFGTPKKLTKTSSPLFIGAKKADEVDLNS